MDALMRGADLVSTVLLAAGLTALLVLRLDAAAASMLGAGLFVLAALPVVRLLGAIRDEAAAGEWRYAALGIVVLVLLSIAAAVALIA